MAPPKIKMKKVWQPSRCPIAECKSKLSFLTKKSLIQHLEKVHGKDHKDALDTAAIREVMKPASEVVSKTRERRFRILNWRMVMMAMIMKMMMMHSSLEGREQIFNPLGDNNPITFPLIIEK